jgi:hypothetical protein
MHVQLDYFDGFPYLVTRVAPSIFHVALLPADLGLDNLKEVARWQVAANQFDCCLVLSVDSCIYLEKYHAERESNAIPVGGTNVTGWLLLCRPFSSSEDAQRRLQTYIDRTGLRGVPMGDPNKNGRRATLDELKRLAGRQPNGVPVGLERCNTCGEWYGECLDTDRHLAGMVMRVRCGCQNDTLCARCGRPFTDRRVNANYYHEAGGAINHVPGFAAFSHTCPASTGGEIVHGGDTQARATWNMHFCPLISDLSVTPAQARYWAELFQGKTEPEDAAIAQKRKPETQF